MIRTDLAMEATEAYGAQQIPGVNVINEVIKGIKKNINDLRKSILSKITLNFA